MSAWKPGDRAMVVVVSIGDDLVALQQPNGPRIWIWADLLHPLPGPSAEDAAVIAVAEAIERATDAAPKNGRYNWMPTRLLEDLAAAVRARAAKETKPDVPATPAIPDLSALERAVVEAAMEQHCLFMAGIINDDDSHRYGMAGARLADACEALRAARQPPDPVAELEAAAAAMLPLVLPKDTPQHQVDGWNRLRSALAAVREKRS